MKAQGYIVLALLLCASPFAAFAQPAEIPTTYEDYYEFSNNVDIDKHTLSLDDFKQMTKDPAVVIADLRGREEYQRSHIKNAVYIGPDVGLESLQAIAPDKNTTIIFYCANSVMLSRRVSQTYIALPQALYHGYKNSYILENVQDEKALTDLMTPVPQQESPQ